MGEARQRLTSQAQDVARFLDRLHTDLREIDYERVQLRAREQEVARERNHLEPEGRKEQREKLRELEKKLESVLRDFEYRARETVNAVQDRAQALKLSKDAERRIAKMRREFREQFDSTVVAHSTGADTGDRHAQPHVVKQVSVGDTVRLKSLGRDGTVLRHFDDDTFEIAVGPMKMKVARDDIASVVMRAAAIRCRRRARAASTCPWRAKTTASPPRSTSSARRWTRRPERWRSLWTALSWRARSACAWCTAAAWESCAKPCGSSCKSHPHVATVSEPPQNEGGGGATVVELRT